MANNDLEKFLAGSGLNRVWEKVFSLVKILTGDVDVSTKGTLQKQLDDVRAIANGRKQGKVFATTDDMKTWLQNSANAGLLNIGDNLYIVEKDVPDWWISGVLTTADSSTGYFYTIEPLEGPKIDLSSYDTAISKLNGDISTHKSSGDHDSRYALKSHNHDSVYSKTNHSHAWSAITGKPSSFTPASHTHDDRYFTESEINNKLKDLVITKDFTSSKFTVGAQSAKQVAISFSVPSGYKMLNNVIVKTGGAVLLAYFGQRDGSVLTCYMYNFTNASVTCTLTATVPFIKS